MNGFLVAIAFKGIRRCAQAAKQRAVRLSSDCVSLKYLWALPTPTTLKKVDQTFLIAWLNCELNQIQLVLTQRNKKEIPTKGIS